MDNVKEQPDEEIKNYLDKRYLISQFNAAQSILENSYFENEKLTRKGDINDNVTQERIEILAYLSCIDKAKAQKSFVGLHHGMDDADQQPPLPFDFSDDNFVDLMVNSTKRIAQLEKSIGDKKKLLLDSERAIKVVFSLAMTLQKQILQSHQNTCNYMIEDLKSVGNLLGSLDKPIGKTKVEAEATLWEKESEKTNVLMNNLKEYFNKTMVEIFSKNYKNLHNVPIFTFFLSDNTSILHQQFFDHFSELYIRGQANEDFIKKLHDDFSQIKSDVERKFKQLSDRANNAFRYAMQENNHSIFDFNSSSEDEIENPVSGERNTADQDNNNEYYYDDF